MCGICGIAVKNKINQEDKLKVEKMTAVLAHRGPDDSGFYANKKLSMGMRRLSIIDLKGGKQPLFNENKKIVLIANAEIYNFVELARELKRKGHKFKTESDCETIVHLYEECEEKLIKKLRGMFAFALFDMEKNKLFIARDRMGEKPLYYSFDGEKFLFSSEMKSIIKAVKKPIINPKAIDLFLTYQFIREPLTLIKQIKKLEAGHYLTVNLNTMRLKIKKYWDPMKIKPVFGKPEIVIRKSIEDIMKIIIRSDVPVGVSLSGGIDSSIIAVLANKFSTQKINAFSVGYYGRPESDERNKAKKLAKKLKMPFYEIEITTDDLVKDFPKMIFYMDDPIGDIASYGYYKVMGWAREKKIPVMLNGIGGDELFWGYPWIKDCLNLAFKKQKEQKVTGKNRHIFLECSSSYQRAKGVYYGLYTSKFRKLINKENLENFYPQKYGSKIVLKILKDLFDLWLIPDCLALGDRLSMAWAVELRSPFLDYKFVETVLGLILANPDDYKLASKKRLKDAVLDIVPNEILARSKQGFTPPGKEWKAAIVKNFGYLCDNGFLIKNGFLKPLALKLLFKKNINLLYRIVIFELWIKIFLKKEI